MKLSKLYLSAAIAALVSVGGIAQADGFYYGGGFTGSYAESGSTAIIPFYSEAHFKGLNLTVGKKFETGAFFVGAELNANIAFDADHNNYFGSTCNFYAIAPYVCENDGTVRARAVVGTEITNGISAFGSLGYGVAYNTVAITPYGSTADVGFAGMSYGIGLQKTLGNGSTIRAEVIRDQFEALETVTGLNWDATSVAVSYLLNF